MGILQGIAYEDAVLLLLEDDLFLQDDSSHAIGGGRHLAGIKLTNVLVSLRTEIVALILVEAQVELRSMLNHRAVERRQQNVVLIVQLGHGNNKQTVVLARIAVD